ncbi:MAG TPA: nitrogen fixation protein FixH [Polaromonas sp.]|uniref:nitrogen fixation protein FixH n=1 Tax=Polaromonas sp. UBA4122 TaxID=1947074 RepID=UPI000EC06076|nr:nitrogen fixation protein FixH [Polaromonas sp. UBA4122]HAL36748.1 nitrogen fixation protein FixH [Polaromonas sp.]
MYNKQAQPWWKFGHVWLVIAGPAIVVVASFVTLYLAITIPDPVSNTPGHRQVDHGAKPDMGYVSNLAPAMQARNHAATGVPVPSQP